MPKKHKDYSQQFQERHQEKEEQCNREEQKQQDRNNDGNENRNDEDGDSSQEMEGKWKKIEKPDKCISLYMIDFNQCDGKKCTGRKMQRFGMLKSIKDKDKKKKFRGVVLSAYGEKPISIQDLELCVKHGICVIDCSWNRIEQTSSFRFKNERILPYVVAGNPVNYGKPFQLSCVEALTTALCAINYIPQAEYIMSKFGWADGFWSINSRIKDYANCKNADDLQKMSQQVEQSENTMKQRSYDISSSSSSSEDEQNEEQNEKQQEISKDEHAEEQIPQQQQIIKASAVCDQK